jgi:hypothetical protein
MAMTLGCDRSILNREVCHTEEIMREKMSIQNKNGAEAPWKIKFDQAALGA